MTLGQGHRYGVTTQSTIGNNNTHVRTAIHVLNDHSLGSSNKRWNMDSSHFVSLTMMTNLLGLQVQIVAVLVLCFALIVRVIHQRLAYSSPPLPPGPPGNPIFGNYLPKALYVVGLSCRSPSTLNCVY
jgi:hypothetical protein